jgi:hypothetical protein
VFRDEEADLCTLQTWQPGVVILRGNPEVANLTLRERGSLSTQTFYMNAGEIHASPHAHSPMKVKQPSRDFHPVVVTGSVVGTIYKGR